MGSNISQAYNARQYIYNNVVQSSKENCVISCTNNSSDFLVLLDNVNIKGNVDFSQYCGIQGATCLLKSYIDSNINNVINSIAQQTQIAEADIFAIDFSKYNQSVNVNQQIVNNVTQVSSASCQQSVDNSNSNNVFIAVDSSIGGNLNLSQRGDINNVTCSLNNMISNQVSNSETSKSTQSIIKGSGILFAIIAMIIAVALFCV
jgi:cobalamin biosynthesis Mg chelatase CobN